MNGEFIVKNTVLLNFHNLGYTTQAQLIIKIDKSEKNALKEFLCFHNNINTVYKINNGYDFIAESVHKTIRELDKFIEFLHSKFKIQDIQIHYLVNEVKKEGFVLN